MEIDTVTGFRLLGEITEQFYRQREDRPVSPPDACGASPAELDEVFAGTLTEGGLGLEGALEEFAAKVLPASMGMTHPLYLGLVNSSPLPGAAFADFLVSTLNNNGGASHQGPPFCAAEREVIRYFKGLCRQPETASGIILPGGSYANLHGLQVARTAACGEGGLKELRRRALRLYVSEASHFSNMRAAAVLGLDPDEVVAVRCQGRGEMDVEDLRGKLWRDKEAGATPLAVVATLGTTGTGAVDPLEDVAAVCRDEGVWLHVDACYGGAALLLDECRDLCAGIEHADSLAIDPHKWFFVPLTSAVAMTRHAELERRAFAVDASYIPGSELVEGWQRGFPTSRRPSGFTTWMSFRIHGLAAIRESVRRNIQLTRTLEDLLRDRGLDVLPGGRLSVACARHEPSGREDLDAVQTDLAKAVAKTGKAWFSTTEFKSRRWLRFNIVNLYTERRHLDLLMDTLVPNL